MSVFRAPRPVAQLIVSVLEGHGIDAVLSSDDADGWAPHVGLAQGSRVLVRGADEQIARDVIAQVEAEIEEAT